MTLCCFSIELTLDQSNNNAAFAATQVLRSAVGCFMWNLSITVQPDDGLYEEPKHVAEVFKIFNLL